MKYKLSEIMDLIGGGTPKTSNPDYWNGDIPWLSVKDFGNDNRYVYETEKHITELGLMNSSTKLLDKGDIIISARGTVGEIATIPYPMAFNQSCYGLRAKKRIVDEDFLYYLIKYNIRPLKKNTHGSVFDTITRSTFDEIEVDVPDFESQKKIGYLLSDLDKKIQLNNKINNNLEQQAEALFHSLFVKNANPTWNDGVLSDLGTVVAGGTPSKTKQEYYSEHGIAWITPKDLSLNKSKFVSHGEIDISELGFSKSSATKMPIGTVLFSSRAPIGYIAIAANEVTTNQGFKSVVPNENVGTAFMYYLLKFLLPTIEGMASGSTFKEISGAGMKSVPVVIPDNETIEEFNAFCTPIFQQQEALEAENSRLTDIRDALLPKLMSGELDVSYIDL
mgnify:CR=1 FL=1